MEFYWKEWRMGLLLPIISRPQKRRMTGTCFKHQLVNILLNSFPDEATARWVLQGTYRLVFSEQQKTKQGFLLVPTVRINLSLPLSFLGAQDVTVEIGSKYKCVKWVNWQGHLTDTWKWGCDSFISFYVHFKYLFLKCIYLSLHFIRATLQ